MSPFTVDPHSAESVKNLIAHLREHFYVRADEDMDDDDDDDFVCLSVPRNIMIVMLRCMDAAAQDKKRIDQLEADLDLYRTEFKNRR